ncbi:MAG: tyrosine-type recombinase/integrase [Chloroflexi bacterium]|nr:tyrosine-type recombinase/integrase [Chloroflexota bacterium]
MTKPATLGESYRNYLNHADLRSAHTLSAYSRSIELFFQFLVDREFDSLLPIQRTFFTTPEEIELDHLGEGDQAIFLNFAKWLQSSPTTQLKGDKRPYARATVELRIAGVLHWFQYMDTNKWLREYWLHHAGNLLRNDWHEHQTKREKQINPLPDLNAVVMFFDSQPMPPVIKAATDPARTELWETKRLRNRALLHSLAETGGRVSEILSLNVAAFPTNRSNNTLNLDVVGKGGYHHVLHLKEALPAIYDYIRARDAHVEWKESLPLFISHDPRYQGSRMSRIVAWRVVHRAAQALGMADISPQDFRHWRALQLINAGYTPVQVQEYLGHRSVETIRSFYIAAVED